MRCICMPLAGKARACLRDPSEAFEYRVSTRVLWRRIKGPPCRSRILVMRQSFICKWQLQPCLSCLNDQFPRSRPRGKVFLMNKLLELTHCWVTPGLIQRKWRAATLLMNNYGQIITIFASLQLLKTNWSSLHLRSVLMEWRGRRSSPGKTRSNRKYWTTR